MGLQDKLSSLRKGVVIHLYHADLWSDIRAYLPNGNFQKILVSTRRDSLTRVRDSVERYFPQAESRVIAVENRGADMAPFCSTFFNELHDLDIVLKIHSKKSTHDPKLVRWFSYLLKSLIGNESVVERHLTEFADDPLMGMTFVEHFGLIADLIARDPWGRNYQRSAQLAERIKISLPREPSFASGSMFWFRPKALEQIKRLELSFDDFEPGWRDDDTMAHALERLMGSIVTGNGYHVRQFSRDDFPVDLRRLH